MKRIFILIFVLIILPASIALAFSINLDPPRLTILLKPGETKTGEIFIQNVGSSSVKMRSYTEDWVYSLDGSKTFMRPASSIYSCSNWISLDPATFEIGAGETKKVAYKISAPGNASGGHISVIFFESVVGIKEGISVSGRIGTIVYQETEGDTKRLGEVKDISVAATDEASPVTVKLTFQNKGNSHISANFKLKIVRGRDIVAEIPMKAINTLPGDTGTSVITLPKPLKEGKYKALIETQFDDKTFESQSEFTINKRSEK